jgi:hypothetical protein
VLGVLTLGVVWLGIFPSGLLELIRSTIP